VLSLLRRVNQNGNIPEPHIWLLCAEYVFRRDPDNHEVRKGLERMERRELGDAAVLSLEFAPEHCICLMRRALRSSVPNDRTVAAAALSILDQPWSHAELIRVLQESDDQIATAECRAALSALPHPQLHSIVAEWEKRNPHEPEAGPFISMTEMALRTRHDWLSHQMEKLHDRVLPLRKKVLPMPAKSWWR
jgi:hypothetical protein